jgi:hypothetical protein
MFMVLELKGGTSGPGVQVGHGHSTRDQALAAIKSYLKSFRISGRNLEEDYWWARDSEGLRSTAGGTDFEIARSDGSDLAFVENPEIFLRLDGHIRDADDAAHEGSPRLFGDRLQLNEIPKLQFLHLDLGDCVFEHPVAEYAEPAFFQVLEHRVWQSFHYWNPFLM